MWTKIWKRQAVDHIFNEVENLKEYAVQLGKILETATAAQIPHDLKEREDKHPVASCSKTRQHVIQES